MTLVVLLASVYMLVYSGTIESGDSLRFFDAITSQSRYGDWFYDETLWFDPPYLFAKNSAFPLNVYNVDENLNIFLALPLYTLADIVPGIGYVHTVWLFNVIVTALIGGVLFLLILSLGYDETTAIVTVLLCGTITILLPYSQTFFRAPVVALGLLLAALGVDRWRQTGIRSIGWLILAIIAFAVAFFVKNTSLFALPALFILALPDMPAHSRKTFFRRVRVIGLLLLVAFPIVLTFIPIAQQLFEQILTVLPFGSRIDMQYSIPALHTFLFSIGGSIWGTSPILLLALPGLILLHRIGRIRLVWVIVLSLLGYALGHALLTGANWFGGLSWPPRFLVPIVPFVMLGVVPILDKLTHPPRSKVLFTGVGILSLYGLWIQFSGVASEWAQYPKFLPAESNGIIEWSPGLNVLEYLRWVVMPGQWENLGINFAWIRADLPLWAVAFVIVILSGGVLLWRLQHLKNLRIGVVVATVLIAFWGVIVGLGLLALHDVDRAYDASKISLHEILDVLRAEAIPGDVVLLTDNTYERFVLNYDDLEWPRFLILPQQPGEQPGEKQPAEIVSDTTTELLHTRTIPVLQHVAEKRQHLWLLSRYSAFIPWSVRPIERFLAEHYYFMREVAIPTPDPSARLLEFSTASAPDPLMQTGPDYLSDLVFGDSLQLAGYTLPNGDSYGDGDILPISLYWVASDTLPQNYVMTWFLADASTGAVIVQGQDTEPVAGFSPTTSWLPNIPEWDNRAIRIPVGTPKGDYRVWVVVYGRNDGQRLYVQGTTVIDETIGVLPIAIQIRD